ncbi:MAG TPA: dihydrofolate reductase family protein [Candidatus Limnocylindrales bacterium]|jgi:dihydrofolate reductase|nr:dihydrofolate reductase family protein [Candidatus Limnocylindrales bacterium]
MRRVGYYITITTDGMYADTEGGLAYFEPAEEEHRLANHLVRDSGDLVMGRVMYDLMAYWDDLDLDDEQVSDVEREFATYWRQTPKHVVSHGRPTLRPNADLVEGDVVDAVRQMKTHDGPDIMLGAGADLFAELSRAGLIDDYRFLIAPIALGDGKALFASLDEPLKLKLVNSRVFPSGSVLVEYVRADQENGR